VGRVNSLTLDASTFAHIRRQASAGQGGFHIGALSKTDPLAQIVPSSGYGRFVGADVLYVYDCGSEPKRHVLREIRALVATQPCRHLDILALSHFDRDHICGVPHLLKRATGFATVDTILLPYVDDAERLIAMGKAVANAEVDGGRLPAFFTDMVIDPLAALAEFGPRRIVLVRPEDGDDGPDSIPTALPDGPRLDPDDGFRHRETGFTWRAKAARPDRPWMFAETLALPGRSVVWASNVMLVGANADSSVLWKLRPYTRPAKPAAIAQFKAAVEVLFGWAAGTFDARSGSVAERRKMVTTYRTKLATAYKTAFKDKNLTSMSLYSGPLEPEALEACSVDPIRDGHEFTKVGWLGTGDAHLEDVADRTAFEAAYAVDLSVTSTFMFPHHGSIENTDPDALVSDADDWVAAADPIHNWAHPHWSLFPAVEAKGGQFRHVRAAPATAFEEAFLLTAWRSAKFLVV